MVVVFFVFKQRGLGDLLSFLNSVGWQPSALRTSWPQFSKITSAIFSLPLFYSWVSKVTIQIRFFPWCPTICVLYSVFPFPFDFYSFSLYIFCWPVFELIYPIFCCVQCAVKTIWWILLFLKGFHFSPVLESPSSGCERPKVSVKTIIFQLFYPSFPLVSLVF